MNCQNINVKHVLARLLIAALGFTQILPAAYAASTDISDTPLAVKSSVPPNIMFMLDNSGSMENIVPDTPFESTVTYLASCPSGASPADNTVAGGVAGPGLPVDTDSVDIQIQNGVPKIMRRGTTGPSNLTSGSIYNYGTANGQKCFDPTKRYNVRLYANNGNTSGNPPTSCTNTCSPSGYLDAVYEGNYLNWYFGSSTATPAYTTAGNFGTSLSKPGTQRRIDITKVAAKSVIDSLNNVRLGLSSYNSVTSGDGGELLEIMGDIAADPNRTRIKAKIDAIKSSGNTPLAETLSDIGRYFTNGYAGSLTLHPGPTGSSTATVDNVFSNHTIQNKTNTAGYGVQTIVPPIQYFCQKSFAILMTDGRPQGDRGITSYLQDYTGDCSSSTSPRVCDATQNSGADTSVAVTSANYLTLKNGVKVGRGYEAQGSDYLDDVAAGMFDIDLRPDLVKPAGSSQKKNNLLTYPIGFAEIQLLNDPFLQSTADKGQGLASGGGLSLNATNAATLETAFQSAADDILGKDRGASAVAVANANVSSQDGDNQSFASSYNAGSWTGDLQAYPIDLTTGQPDQSNPTWITGCAKPNAKVDLSDPNSPPKGCSAQEQLNERTTPRLIATYSGTSGTGQGLQFQPAGATGAGISTTLTSTQQASLNTPVTPPGPSDGNAVIAYLRGARTGEVSTYRSRNRTLGDIVNAEPVIVNKPKTSYADAGYNAFKTQWATTTPRTRMVYQGANDGMLHAFNATTGAEEWAYIPNLVIPTLNNLSRRSGFAHKFYVDGTPTSGDVDFNNVGINGTGASDWHTMLIGGLAKGGRGFYALDVTDPIASSEAAVAGKVLWEFPNSATDPTVKANIGYSFGKPVIAKIQIGAVAKWVVLVTSGYDNGSNVSPSDGTGGDGGGYLFVLDAKTGGLIQAVPTSVSGTNVGTSATPSGLAQISAYVDNSEVNNITTTVYGGDLNGNLWRFNLAGAQAGWNATRLAILKDSGGATQPVTTVPELANIKMPSGIYKRFVYVGTGQYLGDKDPLDSAGDTTKENSHTRQTQTMYGLVDDGSTTIDGRSTLQPQTVSENAAKDRTYSQNTVDFVAKKGWYFDLPITGERSVTDPQLALGALVFTTNIPITTPCVPGGTSYLNVLDYKTGGNIDLRDPATNALIPSGSYLGDALASRGVLIKLPDVGSVSGAVKALIRRSDGTTTTAKVPVPTGALSGKRVSWREVPDR